MILEEANKSYLEIANIIFSNTKLQRINKNILVREAIENKNSKNYDSYVSAIMLKYWTKLEKYYYKCKLVATPEDVHGWLSMAVQYALEEHPWTDKDSSIYNDKNGPDKVINRVMESRRVTFYQQLNRDNRKLNGVVLSIDSLTEDYSDSFMPKTKDNKDYEINELVVSYFKHKDYFKAFMMDALMYEGITIDKGIKPLISYLYHIDDKQCNVFAERYNLNENKVQKASTYITRLDREEIKHKIKINTSDLRRLYRNAIKSFKSV